MFPPDNKNVIKEVREKHKLIRVLLSRSHLISPVLPSTLKFKITSVIDIVVIIKTIATNSNSIIISKFLNAGLPIPIIVVSAAVSHEQYGINDR